MTVKLMPGTLLGRLAVWMNALFLAVVAASVFMASALGLLDYDDPWWDVTATVFFLPLAALVVGLVSLRNGRNRTVLLFLSLAVSVCAVLFILLHSLFISD